MYRCNNCGTVFEEPLYEKESRGEFWGSPSYEDMYYCPYCRNNDFDEWNWWDEEEEDEL